MGPTTPPEAPGFLGWILFAVTALAWLISFVFKLRSESASTTKTTTETLKMNLDLLQDQASTYETQLRTISEALSADTEIIPSDEQIRAVARSLGSETSAGQGLAKHMQSRKDARVQLPLVIERLSRVQARRVEIARDLAGGVFVEHDDVKTIANDLRTVSSDIARLIREIAESPRIFVGSAPPTDGMAEGDLFVAIPDDE